MKRKSISAGKLMALCRLRRDIVGNTLDQDTSQGWNFPLPEDDRGSCDGTEDSIRGNQFEQQSLLDDDLQQHFLNRFALLLQAHQGQRQLSLVTGMRHARQLLPQTIRGHSTSTMTGYVTQWKWSQAQFSTSATKPTTTLSHL